MIEAAERSTVNSVSFNARPLGRASSFLRPVALALVVAALAACEDGGSSAAGVPCPAATGVVGGLDYRLGVGDKLKVAVVGQPEIGGENEVDASGKIVVGLVGEVPAAGRTVGEVQNEVVEKLRGKILVNPQVAVQVSGYRPVTVIGQVRTPGRYPFSFGLDVRGAVALAAGYDRRGSQSKAVIFRIGQAQTGQTAQKCDAGPETPLLPGDTIEIPRRGMF